MPISSAVRPSASASRKACCIRAPRSSPACSRKTTSSPRVQPANVSGLRAGFDPQLDARDHAGPPRGVRRRERALEQRLVGAKRSGVAHACRKPGLDAPGQRRLGEDLQRRPRDGLHAVIAPRERVRILAAPVGVAQRPHRQRSCVQAPSRSQRRPEATMRSRRRAGRPAIARSRDESATSSISASGGKPPAATNAERSTNMPWSPVQMPVEVRARVHERGDHGQQARAAGEGDVEASPARAALQRPRDRRVGAVGQAGVGVQEQQDVGAARARPDVHLHGASARARQHPVGVLAGEGDGVVATAAVDDDHLVAGAAQRREGAQRVGDAGGLVEHRNHDGELHASASCGRRPPETRARVPLRGEQRAASTSSTRRERARTGPAARRRAASRWRRAPTATRCGPAPGPGSRRRRSRE